MTKVKGNRFSTQEVQQHFSVFCILILVEYMLWVADDRQTDGRNVTKNTFSLKKM